MENEELDNELVVNDVPETSEENLEEVSIDTSENAEQNQDTVNMTEANTEDDIEKQIEERVNKLFEEKVEERLIRDRASRERKQSKELAKYKQLENVIKAGLGVENIDEAITKSSNFYKEQGIDIPEFKDGHSEREERIIAEADAKEIIELGRDEMQEEVNKLASIPYEDRTVRERTMFNIIGEELMNLQNIDELKAKGYKTDILSSKEFTDFKKQFNINTPILQIYDMYNKINKKEVVQPASPGSAKTNTTNSEVKEYYTPEEVRAFTEEDLDNPKLMKAIEYSMQKWSKSK